MHFYSSDCRTWGQRGFCKTGSYVSYMKKNCKKTCKLCWIYYLNTRVYIYFYKLCSWCMLCPSWYVLFVFYSRWKTLIGRLHPCLTRTWRENWHVQCIETFCQCPVRWWKVVFAFYTCLQFITFFTLQNAGHTTQIWVTSECTVSKYVRGAESYNQTILC